ncbi:hypothetical protein BHE74_00010653 [Ensete ventricosum]|uniref:Uncharacterized protein n=1 Tax=Ensete ventricosum TaxID=4639 RepID=A0A444E4G8_ENSVE|nr:hypothetical protein GW17_00031446 [Ensete ventricosum]RWW80982.1 hypothetical protein BHE74_00010653 [Ensete ventricosum]RZR75135.1 hypothetical protein BHM03_00050060 [Ensete ventricosum]
MRRDLPPRHRGFHCNLHAPTAPLHVITNNHSPLLAALCAGDKDGRGRQHLAGWSLAVAPLVGASRAVAPCGLVTGGNPLGAGHWRPPLAHATLQPAPLQVPHYGRLSPLRAGHSPPCLQASPLAS